jgi:hypothetical protein
VAHAIVRVLERGDKRLDSARVADIAERPGCSLADLCFLLVTQRFDQPSDVSLGFQLPDICRSKQRHGRNLLDQSDVDAELALVSVANRVYVNARTPRADYGRTGVDAARHVAGRMAIA